MRKPKPLLDELCDKGKPLAEVVVILKNQNQEEVAAILDDLAEDISATVLPAYFQPEDDAVPIMQLRMEATKEALLREFGWELKREKYYDSSEHDGQYPDRYSWAEVNEPQFYPAGLESKIKEMGLTQPGNSDNGAKDDVEY